MRLPTWDEIISHDDQRDVLEYPLDQPLFVVGPPGSGKTILALHRAQMIADSGHVKIITYNRMLRRSLELLGKRSIAVQTMHQFVWQNYRVQTSEEPPRVAEYDFDWQAMLRRVNNNQKYHGQLHLIVDEGQDLPQDFFRYTLYVSKTLTVFADEEQALTTRHSTINDIRTAANLNDPLILTKNHRNSPEIARVAEFFHSGRLPPATVVRGSTGDLPRLLKTKDVESTATNVSNWYNNRAGSIGVIVKRNETSRELYSALRKKLSGKRVDRYTHEQLNEDSINLLSPGVTLLNKESVKGQEFDTVFILELESFIPFETPADRRAMYMMCARARDNLFLVYGPGSLSIQAENTLPGPEALERP